MFSIFVETTGNDELRGPLMQVKSNLEMMGEPQPKVVYVDNPMASGSLFQEVWPGIQIKQDIFHLLKRIGEEMPQKHGRKWEFVYEASACLTMPFDRDKAESAAAEARTSLSEITGAEAKFRTAYDRLKGRWKTLPAAEAAEKLKQLREKLSKLREDKNDYCQSSHSHLVSDSLLSALDRAIDLVAAGYCEDPFSTEDMYFHDGKGIMRCRRGTNIAENRHRLQNAAFVGTKIGPDLAHDIIVNHNYRDLLRTQANAEPGEYAHYGTSRQDLLHEQNVLCKALGAKVPFPNLSLPHKLIKDEHVVVGTKTKPIVVQRIEKEAAEAAAAAAPFLDDLAAVHHPGPAVPQPAPSTAPIHSSETAQTTQVTYSLASISEALRKSPKKLAEAVAPSILIGAKRQHSQAVESSPTPSKKRKSLAKRTGHHSPKSPIKTFHPLKPDVQEYRDAFMAVFAEHDGKANIDWGAVAVSWNRMVEDKSHAGKNDVLLPATGNLLRQYYEREVRPQVANTLSKVAPPPSSEDAGGASGSQSVVKKLGNFVQGNIFKSLGMAVPASSKS